MQDMEPMLLEQIRGHEEIIREHQNKLARLKAALEAYRGASHNGHKCEPRGGYEALKSADAAALHLETVERALTKEELFSALIEGGCKISGKTRTLQFRNFTIAIGSLTEGAKATAHPRFYLDESGRVGLMKWKSSRSVLR